MSGVPDRIVTEDGWLAWFRADVYSKTQARREMANEAGEPVGFFSVVKRWMREAVLGDPNVEQWMLDEGWYRECKRTEPGAVPVWRVE